MSQIQTVIENQMKLYNGIGHPAIMEMFILRNGKDGVVGPLIGEVGTPKECFKNATDFCLANPDALYVEGYFMRPDFEYLVHHAWAEVDGKVMDNTITNAPNALYFGVSFEREVLFAEIQKNGVYGILATPMINVELMMDRDDGLSELLPSGLYM